MWFAFVKSHGRIIGYATWPGNGAIPPLPPDVPCDDWLVRECREAGEPVWPVWAPITEAA
jgi:hypothetical protein